MKKLIIIFTVVLLILIELKINPVFPAGSVVLDWVGVDLQNQNYYTDGVNPDSGIDGDQFDFRIKYVALDNAAPSIAQLWIDRNGDGDYNDTNERHTMAEYDTNDKTYSEPEGKIYQYLTIINYKGSLSVPYTFYFKSTSGSSAYSQEKYISVSPGDNYPRLTWTGETNFENDGVHRENMRYIFHITYIHNTFQDDMTPFRAEVWIDIDDDGGYESDEKFTMDSFNEASYDEGRIFEYIHGEGITFDDDEEHTIAYRFYFEDDYNGTIAIGAEDIVGDPTDETNNTFTVTGEPEQPGTAKPTLYFYRATGYQNDGVQPGEDGEGGDGGTQFTFKVTYQDAELKESPGKAQVWIDIDNNEKYDSYEKYNMQIIGTNDSEGEFHYQATKTIYYARNTPTDDDDISFRFYFENQDGTVAIDDPDYDGDPTDPAENDFDMDKAGYQPEISWPQDDVNKCVSIDPESGDYSFTIIYKDEDNVAPLETSLYIDINKDGDYTKGERRTMVKDPNNDDFDGTDGPGVAYIYSTSFDPNAIVKGENYSFRFLFHDGKNIASGPPNEDNTFQFINDAPTLTHTGTHLIVNGGQLVHFTVNYKDKENNPPLVRELWLYGYGDGDLQNIDRIEMQAVDPNDYDYMNGKDYTVEKRFYYCGVEPNEDVINYSYHFEDKYNLAEDASGDNFTITVKKVGTTPNLGWWGETGFENDGVHPNLIDGLNGFFKFKINYKDPDNQAPLFSQLWIDTNNNGLYDSSERYAMVPSSTQSTFTEWRSYYYIIWISAIDESKANTFHYRFYFNDGANMAQNVDTVALPVVHVDNNDPYIKVNIEKSKPELSWVGEEGFESDGVDPDTVQAGGPATFRVQYASSEGMAPQDKHVWIDLDGDAAFEPDEKYSMFREGDVNEDPNYRLGVIYGVQMPIFYNGTQNLKYKFHFSDREYSAVGVAAAEKLFSVSPGGIIPQISWGEDTVKGLNFNRETNNVCFSVEYQDGDEAHVVVPFVSEIWLDINQNDFYEDDEKRQMSLEWDSNTVYIYCVNLDTLVSEGFSGANLSYQFKFANQNNFAQGEATERAFAFKEPTLSWSQADPNFVDKGVYPELARSGSTVTFKVSYETESNDLPVTKQVWVWSDPDDDGDLEIDVYIDMNMIDPNSIPIEYEKTWVTPQHEGGWVNYRFIFNDGYKDAVSNPTYVDSEGKISGPAEDSQFYINRPPILRFNQDSATYTVNPNLAVDDPNAVLVDPNFNVIDPNFAYMPREESGLYTLNVIYADADNHPPDPNAAAYIILDANTPISQSLALFARYEDDDNYEDGKIYTCYQVQLLYNPENNGNHTYRIHFYDGYHESELLGSFYLPPYYEVPELFWPENEEFEENQAIKKDPYTANLYNFQITYSDADALDPNKSIEELIPQRSLLVDLDNDGVYDPNKEIFEMEEIDPVDTDLVLGKIFIKDIEYSGNGPLTYRFLFHDGHNIAAGAPSEDTYFDLIIPTLTWTGESGFKVDGIESIDWEQNQVENFEFRIKYEDRGGVVADVRQVWIDINGNDEYEDDEKYDMNLYRTSKDVNSNIRVSYYSYKIVKNQILYDSEKPIKYKFYFLSPNNRTAITKTPDNGDPTEDQLLTSFGSIPLLSFTSEDYPKGVDPEIGESEDAFNFRVTYSDADDEEPQSAQVLVYLDANTDPTFSRNLVEASTANDYSEGKDFYTLEPVRLNNYIASGIFKIIKYRFLFSDYHNIAHGTPTYFHSFVLNNHRPSIDSDKLDDVIFKVGEYVNIKKLVLEATTDPDVEYGDELKVSYLSESQWVSANNLLTFTSDDVGEGHRLWIKVVDQYGEEDIEIVTYSVSDIIGSLSGKLVELGDETVPIEGAEIAVIDPNQTDIIVDPNMIKAISDPNGNFRLTVNEGTYKLIVSKPEFEMKITSPITIDAGQDSELIAPILLNPYVGLISGWVQDLEERDMVFAKVRVTAVRIGQNYRRGVYCLEPDADNKAYFNLYLPNGDYNLIVSGEDYKTINVTNGGVGFEVNHNYNPDFPNTYPNPSQYSELGITLETKVDWRITSYEVNVSEDPNIVINETKIIIAQEGVIEPDIAEIDYDYNETAEIIGVIDPNSKQLPEDDYAVPHYQIIYNDYAGEATGTVRITLEIPAKDKYIYVPSVMYAFDIHPEKTPAEDEVSTNEPLIWLTTQNSIDPDLGGTAGFDPKTLGQYFDSTYIYIPPGVLSEGGKMARIKRGARRDTRQVSYEYTIDILGDNDLPDSAALLFDEDEYLTISMQIDPNRWNGHLPDVEIRYYEDSADIEWKTSNINPKLQKINNRTIAFKTNHLSTFAGFSIIPTNLDAEIKPDGEIHLVWEDNAMNETGFRVQRSINTGGNFINPLTITLDDPNITECTDSNIEIGIEYMYRVQALTRSGGTSYSNTVTIRYPSKGGKDDSGVGCFITIAW
ncbi:MAG: carboxypeptidase regulatory-like domain-containing protein [bacterium]